jgi:phage terminase large subunit-like protein
LKRAVREQVSLFNASVVLIEDKASGTQLIQELIADGCSAVTRYKLECDKIMPLHAQTAMIEDGFVHLPETATWLAGAWHSLFPPLAGKEKGMYAFQRLHNSRSPVKGGERPLANRATDMLA